MGNTVADVTDAGAQPAADVQGAPEDLDTLLAKFDQEFDQGKKVATEPKTVDKTAVLEESVNQLQKQLSNADFEKAIDMVSTELGDLKLPRAAIKGTLNGYANENPALVKAFENRYNDPTGWNKVMKATAKKMSKDFEGLVVDKTLTEDRSAIAAVVRGASKTAAPEGEAPNFSGWSDNRFNHWKLYGKDNPNL